MWSFDSKPRDATIRIVHNTDDEDDDLSEPQKNARNATNVKIKTTKKQHKNEHKKKKKTKPDYKTPFVTSRDWQSLAASKFSIHSNN